MTTVRSDKNRGGKIVRILKNGKKFCRKFRTNFPSFQYEAPQNIEILVKNRGEKINLQKNGNNLKNMRKLYIRFFNYTTEQF